VKVEADDVQNLPAGFADVVTARAVAELADLLALTAPQLKTDGAWLLLKGEAVEREINALKSPFRSPDDLTIEKHPSIVSPSGCVLVIRRT
jgi:16S rRNA G527 N7-methylase RsmG